MMIRIVVAVAVVAVGISTVVADVVSDRKALMKRSAAQAKLGAAIKAGREPFDLVKAKAVFETYIDKANKLPTMFPDKPKAGEETTAAAAIWDKPADFKAAVEKFGRDRRLPSMRPRIRQASRPSLISCRKLRQLPRDLPHQDLSGFRSSVGEGRPSKGRAAFGFSRARATPKIVSEAPSMEGSLCCAG